MRCKWRDAMAMRCRAERYMLKAEKATDTTEHDRLRRLERVAHKWADGLCDDAEGCRCELCVSFLGAVASE